MKFDTNDLDGVKRMRQNGKRLRVIKISSLNCMPVVMPVL